MAGQKKQPHVKSQSLYKANNTLIDALLLYFKNVRLFQFFSLLKDKKYDLRYKKLIFFLGTFTNYAKELVFKSQIELKEKDKKILLARIYNQFYVK